MKQEIEALEAQLAAEDSALLESTVREANVTLETSHLESIVSKPSEVEMETSNADLTVKEPGDVETETNDDNITVREPCEVDNETSKAGMTVGDHIEVEMETSDDDITVREPCEVDSETSKAGMTVGDHIEVEMEANDVESSVIGPSNPDDIHKTGVCGLKRKPERMPTSLKTCPLEEEKCSPSREEDRTNKVPPTDATEIDIQCISSSQESEDLFLSPRSPSPPPSLPDTNIKPSAVSQVVLKLKEIFKAVSPGHCGNSPNKYRGLSPDSAKSTPPCSPRSERPLVSAQKSIYKDPTSDTSLASPAGSRVKAGLPKPFQSPAFTGVLQGKGSRFRTPQRSNVMSPLGRTTPSGDGKSSSRRLCFVTTGLHLSQAQRTQKLAQMFNIKIQPKFSPAATHVIVKTVSEDSLVCERTFKYFQAIAHHCWLISYQWVEDCITANEILPETGYEIQGDTVSGPKHRGPRRSRLYNNPVFADFEFFCNGDSPNLPPGEFQNLLTVSGGTVVTSPDALGVDPEKTQLILDLNEDQHPSNIRLFNRLYRKYGVVTVSREWVFDTITQYKVQPLPHYVLTSLPNIELPFV
ncbi:breast cancer type 1 susceptibility protein homolog [Liolophura sinensis]|uniref:breast cancer type 1 susceptibility protein homolog n=1 Tax=Liolophura sinensis TaxID=3198878 RepID=UPI003157F2A7